LTHVGKMDSLSTKITVKDVDFTNKRVLVRTDFNVPIRKNKVADPRRIVETIPTLQLILSQSPRCVIIMSHRGRPNGERNEKYSLQPVVPILQDLLKRKVVFLPDCVGSEVEKACSDPQPGTVFLLENLRFHLAEEGKGKNKQGQKVKASKEEIQAFRTSLSKLGDVYVNDAFGTAHRPHSSMVGVDVPIKAGGLLMSKELSAFGEVLTSPPRPFLALLGGAKVADKLPLIMNLLEKVDELIISGGMAFTFLKTIHSMPIGNSLFDQKGSEMVPAIMKKAQEKNVKIHLPVDFAIGNKFDRASLIDETTLEKGIPDGWMGLDVGSQTRMNDASVIYRAKTIVLNGPAGAFELPSFAYGTITCLHAIAAATEMNNALTIIGGGDSAAAALRYGVDKVVSHVSTGGGASLELLEGKVLPGISYLSSRASPKL